ncbi:MAG: Hsp20/alpha crystallin family protein [Nitrospirota bacterium]
MDIKNLIPFRKKNPASSQAEENPFSQLQREMNRMFDSFAHTMSMSAAPEFSGSFMPRVDVSENDKAILITAELPGMSEKDIDISISEDVLVIRGEKKEDKEEKSKNYYYSERSFGSFNRSIPLPREINADKISADFKKGILTVTLPKSAKTMADVKKIPIKTE